MDYIRLHQSWPGTICKVCGKESGGPYYEICKKDKWTFVDPWGLNGCGNWSTYLQDVEYVVSVLSKRFRKVELYDWKNDVLDDVWDLKLVLRS